LELTDPYQSAIDVLIYSLLFDKQERIRRETKKPKISWPLATEIKKALSSIAQVSTTEDKPKEGWVGPELAYL
jgi:hypothetical protein